jgi:4-hydroxy-2-oxoheptanedioate aldolase
MRPNRLRELFRDNDTAVNGWLSSDSPYVAEALSHSGFDAVTVDLQHGVFGVDGALRLLQAVGAGPAVPMARCPDLDPAVIGKLLDGGAYGVICPAIDTPAQAAAFVDACRYPPVGRRSYGPARGLLHGGPDYVDHADETVLTWAMIESAEALAHVDEIVATPGLDGVYVGPNDLALSLGERPGAAWPPAAVADALPRIAASARAAGRVAGAFCADGEVGRWLVDQGYDLVTPGNDIGILRAAAAERVAQVRARDLAAAPGGY